MRSPERTTSADRRNSAQIEGALPHGHGHGRGRRRSGFVETSDGIHLYYEVFGDGTPAAEASAHPPPATTLVLCDGLACDGYVWKYIKWALARDYRLVHFHYRGHGRSSLPADLQRVKLSDFTRDALTALSACNIERAVFCGHSMGVQVALDAYHQAPERVAGLILACGSYGNPLRTFKGSDQLEKILPYLRSAVARAPSLVGAVWRKVIPTDLTYYLAQLIEIDGRLIRREDFQPYLEGVSRVDPMMIVATAMAAGEHSAQQLLPSMTAPALILAGRRDSFVPLPIAEEMHRKIPDSELYVVDQGTHNMPIERPAEVTEVIADFLSRRVVGAPA